ncbi:MAG: peptidoglycan-binding domain-containing protein [bacterium]|nr:peptidoglycan-binding domain-containing protein [bacterium]
MRRHAGKAILLSILLSSSVVFGAEQFTKDLLYGMRGNADVTRLQQFLTDQGVYSGPISGDFFSLTRDGVQAFQKKKGIEPASGYVGTKTRAVMNARVNSMAKIEALQNFIKSLQAKLDAIRAAEKTALIVPAVVEAISTLPVVVVQPEPPKPFMSTLKIEQSFPSRNLSSYTNVILGEFKFSAQEKIGISRFRLTNEGTLTDQFFANVQLFNTATNEVLAVVDGVVNGIIEFKMPQNDAKKNKGFMVSGELYYITTTIITPNYGAVKPYAKFDLKAVSDIDAFDYDNPARKATISTSTSQFPIEGSKQTVI